MKVSIRIFAVLLLWMLLIEGSAPVVSAPVPASVPANILGVAVGAYLRPTENWGNDVSYHINAVGPNGLSILTYTLSWVDGDASSSHVLNTRLLDLVRTVAAPNYPAFMITWQPLGGQITGGCSKNYAPLEMIPYPDLLSGSCDAYIRQFATDLSARPERFLIRFANEPNVSASQWWPGHFGLGPEVYIALYRHVHDVFLQAQKDAGKVNTEWIWSPNYFSYPAVTWNLLHNYYPGSDYVDWIGLSGYNWYLSSRDTFRWFSEIFGEVDGSNVYYSNFLPGVLYDLACRYAKPQIIGEYGTTDYLKQAWITDAFARIPNYPFLRGVVWYNDVLDGTGADFRVASTPLGSVNPAVTTTYRNAISASTFSKPLPSLKDATPPATFCANSKQLSTTFSLAPSALLAVRGTSYETSLTGMFYAAHPAVNIISPAGVDMIGQITVDGLNPPWGRDQIRISVGSGVPNGQFTLAVQVDGTTYPLTVTVVDNIYPLSLPLIRK